MHKEYYCRSMHTILFIKIFWYFNKKATIFFVLFVLFWGFINVKRGAVATPVLQYGMYSNPYYLTDTQTVLHIYLNDKKIDFAKYSMSERDQLQIFLEDYLRHKENNQMVFTTMKRILSKVQIGKLMTEDNYTCALTDEDFTRWYTKIIERITHEKVVTLAAYHQKYILQSGKLVAVSAPLKINHLVAY